MINCVIVGCRRSSLLMLGMGNDTPRTDQLLVLYISLVSYNSRMVGTNLG